MAPFIKTNWGGEEMYDEVLDDGSYDIPPQSEKISAADENQKTTKTSFLRNWIVKLVRRF